MRKRSRVTETDFGLRSSTDSLFSGRQRQHARCSLQWRNFEWTSVRSSLGGLLSDQISAKRPNRHRPFPPPREVASVDTHQPTPSSGGSSALSASRHSRRTSLHPASPPSLCSIQVFAWSSAEFKRKCDQFGGANPAFWRRVSCRLASGWGANQKTPPSLLVRLRPMGTFYSILFYSIHCI